MPCCKLHLRLLLECLGEGQLFSPQDWVFLLGSVCCEAAACWNMHCKTARPSCCQQTQYEGMMLQAGQLDMTRRHMDMRHNISTAC